MNWMRDQPDNAVDMVFCSPPYESARLYDELNFRLTGQAWVDWMVPKVREMVRITNGLVAVVIQGRTRNYRWSATPALLMADLHRSGIKLRNPPIFHRVGIPGSGGPDWLRSDYEWILCCSKGGKLPWSDNKAMGHAPKWRPGGKLTYRNQRGVRRHLIRGTSGYKNGDATYHPSTKLLDRAVTEVANPGNVIKCVVGGGKMGSKLAHENEAPFPEKLAEFFIKSFCPPAYCRSCGIIQDYDKDEHAQLGIQGHRETTQIPNTSLQTLRTANPEKGQEVLLQAVLPEGCNEGQGGLPVVRQTNSCQEAQLRKQILREDMCLQVVGEKQEKLQGVDDNRRGVQGAVPSRKSQCSEVGLRDGAPTANVGVDRQAPIQTGSCPPQERQQAGQPKRESRVNVRSGPQCPPKITQEADNLPKLWLPDTDYKICEACGEKAVAPGVTLDPFMGSGTTCAVAKKLGRRYIGIDIRKSQCELAERRIAE